MFKVNALRTFYFTGLSLLAAATGGLLISFGQILKGAQIPESSFTYGAIRVGIPVAALFVVLGIVSAVKGRWEDAMCNALLAFCTNIVALAGAVIFQLAMQVVRL